MENKTEIFGIQIRTNKENGFYNLSDLMNAYDIARIKNKWASAGLWGIFKTARFFYFIEKTFGFHFDSKNATKSLKKLGLQKTTGARATKTIWVHKEVFDYVYRELFDRAERDRLKYRHFDKYTSLINDVFSGFLAFEFEKKVLNYRVDVYFSELNLVVEYDEPHHETPKNKELDVIRQRKISQHLGCSFMRAKVGDELKSVNQILVFFNEMARRETLPNFSHCW